MERLISVAIIRDGQTHSRGFKSHGELRAALGDDDPYNSNINRLDDTEGFLTNTGRFVNRDAARVVGVASGQLDDSWRAVQRPLLSSDIVWDTPSVLPATKAPRKKPPRISRGARRNISRGASFSETLAEGRKALGLGRREASRYVQALQRGLSDEDALNYAKALRQGGPNAQ